MTLPTVAVHLRPEQWRSASAALTRAHQALHAELRRAEQRHEIALAATIEQDVKAIAALAWEIRVGTIDPPQSNAVSRRKHAPR